METLDESRERREDASIHIRMARLKQAFWNADLAVQFKTLVLESDEAGAGWTMRHYNKVI